MPSLQLAKRALLALAITVAAGACGGGSDSINGPQRVSVAGIGVAGVPSLAAGQEVQFTATVTDATGKALTDRAVAWTSTDHTVAVVSESGLVTALSAGTVRIGAASEGKSASVELTVLPRSTLVASVSLDVETLTLRRGETRQLTASARDAGGAPLHGIVFDWSAAGTAGAMTVSSSGLVTAHEMGTVTVTATANGKSAHATVAVLSDAAHDLVFDHWELLGPINRPLVYRLDMQTPGAEPVSTLQSTMSSDAAPSPDGTRIAYVCDGGGIICVANRDGSNPHLLAVFIGNSAFHGDQPAWSPDGAKIAFRGWSDGATPGLFNPTDIWVVNADGSNALILTSADSAVDYYESPTWSPVQADGSYRIAYSHVTRGTDGYQYAGIQSIRANGTDRKIVTAGTSYLDAQPTWSPDGGTIAFVRTGGDVGGNIWLASAAGGNERALMSAAVDPSGEQRAPAWSPDGSQIAFMSSHEIIGTYTAWQVYTVHADGTSLVRRTSDRAEKGNPAWIARQ